jgi:hypothetical protein
MATNKPIRKVKRLFWDIETSPNVVLAFRAGYDININHDAIISERKVICIGYKWEDDPKTHILRWDENQDDLLMLARFTAVANEADELVAHFGDRFDLPWFRTRCLIHGMDPLPPYKTVDTKAWASRNFYFNSNKLDYLGEVLGVGKKHKTDFSLWKDILMKKCPKAMKTMCDYCERDVELLELVYKKLAPYVTSYKTHAGVFGGLDKWTCPRTGSMNVRVNKRRVTKGGTVTYTMQNNETGAYFTISNTAYSAFLEAKKKKPVSKI